MSKQVQEGAYKVDCPKCRAQAGFSCFRPLPSQGYSESLKHPHKSRVQAAHAKAGLAPVKPSRGRVAACKARAKLATIPAETVLDASLEQLRTLRRRLCVYAMPGSDKFCDCKYLRLPMTRDKVHARSEEKSGCCEVRVAIAQLETIKQAMTPEGKD